MLPDPLRLLSPNCFFFSWLSRPLVSSGRARCFPTLSVFFPQTAFFSHGFPVRSSPPIGPDASRPSPSSLPKLLFLLMAFTPTYLRFLSLPVLFCPAGSSCWHLQSLPLPVGRCRTLWLFSDLSIACAHPRQNVLF